MQNLLGDLITRIYNGQQARLGAIILHPATPKSCILVLDLLRDEGYILGYNLWYDPKLKRTFLKVLLKYSAYGAPAIKKIFQISKPTRRIYISTVIL
jgi:ribosomal protein S8